MKKSIILSGTLAMAFLCGQAQMNANRTGFKDDFKSATEHTDVHWASTAPGAYTLSRSANVGLNVTFSQVAGGFNDMEVSFGGTAEAPQTINLTNNANYYIEVENTTPGEPGQNIIILAMYARDIYNNTIGYQSTVHVNEADTWTTRIVGLMGSGETTIIGKDAKGFGTDEDFTLSGTFIGGGDIYGNPWSTRESDKGNVTACNLDKITHIRFRAFNATQAFTNASFRFLNIQIGDQTGLSSINEVSKQLIKTYPNPVTNGVVYFEQEQKNINIFNSMGALVKTYEKAKSIDVADLTTGLYYVQTLEGQSKLFIK